MPVTRMFHRLKTFAFFFVLLGLGLFGHVGRAEAASLFFSPSSGTYSVGQDFSVSVYVGSGDQAMNATQGVITFPSDRLQVTSLSKAGSIMSLWVQEPTFSNGNGTINFEGIVLNPGFQGNSGKIITVNFKVKAAGSGTLSFSSSSVLANDGEGTNILSGLSSANFTLVSQRGEEPAPTPAPAPATAAVPGAPVVTSPTHPDSNKWYSNNNPTFQWAMPKGVNGVNVLADKESGTDPGTKSDGVMSTYTFNNVDDGVWYFHIRLKNDQGWGKVAHFKFQIDTEKPEYVRAAEATGANDAGTGRFAVDAKDALSGIDSYEIKIDDRSKETWKGDGGVYTTPSLSRGRHSMTVTALDRAGNRESTTVEFTSSGIMPPRITDYPRDLETTGSMTIQGLTYPSATVKVFVQFGTSEPQPEVVESGSDGRFTAVYHGRLEKGEYAVWAIVQDKQGSVSEKSEQVTITVHSPGLIRLSSQAANILLIVVPSLLFLIILILLLIHIYRKLRAVRRHIKREIREVESSVHEAFHILETDMKKHIKLLESARTKRELTREEEKIMEQMKRDMEVAEKLVNKEIEDIKREVE